MDFCMEPLYKNPMDQPTSCVPPGYHSIQPYLIFENTTDAIAFYSKVFGATERLCMREDSGRVAHAEIQLGDSCIMMADERPAIEAFAVNHFGGSPITLMVYVPDCDAVYKRAIEAGAANVREPADQPHGDRTAGVRDPFGYTWWISTSIKILSREELEQLL
jgi:PhnB protein